jgi:endonuclease YncB( thermonuclease family)
MFCAANHAATITGKVVTAADGDTITVMDAGKVLVDGRDASLEQVRRGLAWHYKAYLLDQSPDDRLSYAAAEKEAVAARQGLWQDALPIAPWEWRHQTKAARSIQ